MTQPPIDESKKFLNTSVGFLATVIAVVILLCFVGPFLLCFLGMLFDGVSNYE